MCAGDYSRNTDSYRGREENHQKMVIDRVNGRIPILLGVGGNNTRAIVETLKNDDFTGVDAILSVVPYYNKPSQEEFISIIKPYRKLRNFLSCYIMCRGVQE